MRLIKPYKQYDSSSSSNIKLHWVVWDIYTLTINYQWGLSTIRLIKTKLNIYHNHDFTYKNQYRIYRVYRINIGNLV